MRLGRTSGLCRRNAVARSRIGLPRWDEDCCELVKVWPAPRAAPDPQCRGFELKSGRSRNGGRDLAFGVCSAWMSFEPILSTPYCKLAVTTTM